MVNPQRGGEPLTLCGGALGDLHFEWSHDRYAHFWQFPDSNLNSIGRIASCESDSLDIWPVSPPLQQIHQQQFADGRQVIFGVGMAGRGHWSASFTLVPDLKYWIVELACRSPVAPEVLQSTYQLGGEWVVQSDGKFESVTEGTGVRLQIEPLPPGSTGTLADGRIEIHPLEIEKSATTQWSFRLRILT